MEHEVDMERLLAKYETKKAVLKTELELEIREIKEQFAKDAVAMIMRHATVVGQAVAQGPETVASQAESAPTEASNSGTGLPPRETKREMNSHRPVAATGSAATQAVTQPIPASFALNSNDYTNMQMTPKQQKFLVEKIKNIKKTANAVPSLNPVEHIAMNIPSYNTIVKNPMDLCQIREKLKDSTRRFNGHAHAVTQAAFAMEANLKKMMESLPLN